LFGVKSENVAMHARFQVLLHAQMESWTVYSWRLLPYIQQAGAHMLPAFGTKQLVSAPGDVPCTPVVQLEQHALGPDSTAGEKVSTLAQQWSGKTHRSASVAVAAMCFPCVAHTAGYVQEAVYHMLLARSLLSAVLPRLHARAVG
jgi:hypothetical protein